MIHIAPILKWLWATVKGVFSSKPGKQSQKTGKNCINIQSMGDGPIDIKISKPKNKETQKDDTRTN
jgi:hypothetical protein